MPHDEEVLLSAFVELMRELGQFPTSREMRLKRNKQSSFPPDTVYFRRFGSKKSLAEKVLEYAKKKGYDDVVKICQYECHMILTKR